MNYVEPIRDKKEIASILAYARKDNERDFIMLMLGFHTGLRISDILDLKVRDVRNKKRIDIQEQKTGKSKHFLINKELGLYLRQYCKDKESYEYLICSREGINKPITRQRAYQIIKEIGGMFGLEELGCHSLRKSFGYHHYMQYKDVVLLQKIFNHSKPEITLRYIGIEQKAIDDSIEGLSFL
ncbi:site-specific integrase [Clostridium sp. 19966]|uniref:site-specific integrase n=1 Tax=Clostridium sp. 19966 TaxID=2768166 RepID=UPI0028DDA7A2|nr:site-specific integrase [Clostridium sp. 19966]MDT8717616.1 site-specific integrase [Clostridium sp. 19966]